jgi:hypothetical protein
MTTTLDKARREEIVAKMITDYRQELSNLSDSELLEHWKASEVVRNMTEAEWHEAYKRGGIRI